MRTYEAAEEQGNVDAVYIDLPVHAYYLPKYPGLELTGRPGEKGYYAIAFRKADGALCEQFNAALGRLIDGDKLRPIYQKWGVWNDDQRELAHPADPSTLPGRLAGRIETVFRYLAYRCWAGPGADGTILLSVA